MTEQKIVHVALNPPELLGASLVKQVAVILNREVSEARLLLSGRIPKIIAHFDNAETAESVVKNLLSLGLMAFTIDDTELYKPLKSAAEFRAHSLRIEEGQVRFLAQNGAEKIIETHDLFLILYGKMNIPITTKSTQTRMKFSMPATLMTGGIPVWRRSQENVEGVSFQTEYFVRLYDRISSDPEIEVFESSFDYAFLGGEIAPSSSENLRLLVAELRKTFPATIVDSRLTEGTPVMQGSEMQNTCKLIFLFRRMESDIKD
jgi:hypothetical protein